MPCVLSCESVVFGRVCSRRAGAGDISRPIAGNSSNFLCWFGIRLFRPEDWFIFFLFFYFLFLYFVVILNLCF